MSILPSLLTSAMATPSERNLRAMTAFFQVMVSAAAGLAGSAAGTAGRASSGNRAGNSGQNRERIGGPRTGGNLGRASRVGPDYGARTRRVQLFNRKRRGERASPSRSPR